MVSEVGELLDRYIAWLRDKTVLRQVGDWTEITTPHMDRHNDYLQIYAKKQNGNFLLTDDGYIIADLEQSGCEISSPKRLQLLKLTLSGFGVQLADKALQVMATNETFPVKKHNLLQAMLAVNDMFYLSQPMVASVFYDDVVTWLDLHEIRYTPHVKFTGKTGFDHHFDFVIPKSKLSHERIIRAVNLPNKAAAMDTVFAWLDTKEVRPPESKAFALLNDQERGVPADVVEALRSYEVVAVPWSQRETVRQELAV